MTIEEKKIPEFTYSDNVYVIVSKKDDPDNKLKSAELYRKFKLFEGRIITKKARYDGYDYRIESKGPPQEFIWVDPAVDIVFKTRKEAESYIKENSRIKYDLEEYEEQLKEAKSHINEKSSANCDTDEYAEQLADVLQTVTDAASKALKSVLESYDVDVSDIKSENGLADLFEKLTKEEAKKNR